VDVFFFNETLMDENIFGRQVDVIQDDGSHKCIIRGKDD